MVGAFVTIIKWVVLLPILVAVVLLAVANDQSVTVHLNPFDADDPVLRVELALYQVGFLVFALGVVVGGAIAWSSRKKRRRARDRREETALWQARTEWSEGRGPQTTVERSGALLPRPERG